MKEYKYDICISGEHNKRNFNRMARLLRSKGFTVFNLLEVGVEEGWTRNDFMRLAIREQMESESIIMLRGYESSKSAMIELVLAQKIDMDIMYEEDMFE